MLLFVVLVISYFLLRDVILRIFMVAEEFLGLPPDGVQVTILCFSSRSLYRLHAPHAHIRVIILYVFIVILFNCFSYHIIIVCQLIPFLSACYLSALAKA